MKSLFGINPVELCGVVRFAVNTTSDCSFQSHCVSETTLPSIELSVQCNQSTTPLVFKDTKRMMDWLNGFLMAHVHSIVISARIHNCLLLVRDMHPATNIHSKLCCFLGEGNRTVKLSRSRYLRK
jgi:hypothetical protein